LQQPVQTNQRRVFALHSLAGVQAFENLDRIFYQLFIQIEKELGTVRVQHFKGGRDVLHHVNLTSGKRVKLHAIF